MKDELPGLASYIETAITNHYRSLNGDSALNTSYKDYVNTIEDNLLSGVVLDDFREDLSQGAGDELSPRGNDPPKFCTTFSSAALCANCFAPFRRHSERLELLGQHGFTKARFEQRLPTGFPGTPPHLDFYAENDTTIIAIESKFTEYLTPKAADFKPAYAARFAESAEPAWQAVYALLKAAPDTYRYLKAAQLCKHYVGLRHTLKGRDLALFLLYLYWEPVNAQDLPPFRAHREEVQDFAGRVAGARLQFRAMSYADLWNHWEASPHWPGMKKHLHSLRDRYEIAIELSGKRGAGPL